MRITEKFKRSRLANDEIKKIIDAAASRKTAAISFTGGEPFLYTDDLLDLIGYAGKKGIKYIRTGTNGYLFANPQSPRFYDKVQRLAERMSKTGCAISGSAGFIRARKARKKCGAWTTW